MPASDAPTPDRTNAALVAGASPGSARCGRWPTWPGSRCGGASDCGARALWRDARCVGSLDDSGRRRLGRRARGGGAAPRWPAGAARRGARLTGHVSRDWGFGFGVWGSLRLRPKERVTVFCHCFLVLYDWNSYGCHVRMCVFV